jgi:tetratricopeptide (TPR) repeat protein
MYEKSIELRIRIYGEMHEKVAVNYNGLGVTYGKLGDMEGAMKYLNIALEIQINIYGKIHPDTALTYKNMGMGYYFNNLNTEAMNYLQVAHGIYSKLYSNEHRAIREIQRTLDNILRN